LLGRENVVLATGGGIVMRPENRDLLKQHCVLYLRVRVAEQYRHTRKSRRRPLLNATDDPRKRLEELCIPGTVTSLFGFRDDGGVDRLRSSLVAGSRSASGRSIP
jgi:hypothetical protein